MHNFAAVATTINQPSQDLIALSRKVQSLGGSTIVCGDAKTPSGWASEGIEYWSLQEQNSPGPFSVFAQSLPVGHYARKNFGYLRAMALGVDWIFETDDDNQIYEDLFSPPSIGVGLGSQEFSEGWVNVYSQFKLDSSRCSPDKMWPRGFPLELVAEDSVSPNRASRSSNAEVMFPIVQGLVDGDPDVDAIYRLTRRLPQYFKGSEKTVALLEGARCPFNSQNTWWHKDAFQLLYLPVTTTFRVTDILRSYVAQCIVTELGMGVLFTAPTALQIRNDHNLVHDLRDEVPLYLESQRMVSSIEDAVRGARTQATAIRRAYDALHKVGAVSEDEFGPLDQWIKASSETLESDGKLDV